MPHKRAKRSVRDAESAAKGFNNAPTGSDSLKDSKDAEFGGMSKSLYRILNADKIRSEKRMRDVERKRKAEDGEPSSGPSSKKLKIMPNENLRTFNQRVEISMRNEISTALKSSKNARKKAKLSRSAAAKEAQEAEEAALSRPPPRRNDHGEEQTRASDFAGRERVSLNDVAMAPPALNFGKRKFTKSDSASDRAPISLKQKEELNQAREQAIARYREIKAKQMQGQPAVHQ